jgi:D-beta-D-heptose 7-phosphate kinase/D-beta-D-heptose 1-phosphate adenosyltransferase
MTNIWTNGCFDILHIGHLELFKYAKSLGHTLVVGIDGDSRVKELKGSSRPINNQLFRQTLLESIKYIDRVVVFDTDKELKDHIKNLLIDTIVVGDDYKNKTVIGSEHANVIFFPKIPNLSSSFIYESIIR